MSHHLKWSCGVTTVPARKQDGTLQKTLASLKAGGFGDLRLFVDGTRDLSGWESSFSQEAVTVRFPTIRTFGNWMLGMAELYIREPASDLYAMFQDDLLCSRNVRQLMEAQLLKRFPHASDIQRCMEYWNLYTFRDNEEVVSERLFRRPLGWVESQPFEEGQGQIYHGKMQQKGRGAVALVFTRQGVVSLLTHLHTVERPQDVTWGWRRIDGGIVEAMNKAGYREMVHGPSLVQHVGHKSTMGGRPHRQALTWMGEAWDSMEVVGTEK